MPALPSLCQSRLLTIAALALLFVVSGCGGSHNKIVGKWRATGDSNALVWEFSRDGSVLMGSTQGKFTFGDRDRVKIQTPFGTSVYQIEQSGDHMTLKDASGSKLEFAKLK
jgi:hypothetical protein